MRWITECYLGVCSIIVCVSDTNSFFRKVYPDERNKLFGRVLPFPFLRQLAFSRK